MTSLQMSVVLVATMATSSFAQSPDQQPLDPQPLATRSGAEPPITAVVFSPDGNDVVAVSQSGLHVYSWPALQKQRTIEVSASNLLCVAFSPDGKRIAIGGGNPSENGVVEVRSWPECRLVATFDDHADSVRSLTWGDETQIFTASVDREIKAWDLGKPAAPVLTLKGHSRSVQALCLLHDKATLISAGVDQSVRVWDAKSGQLIRSMNQHVKPVHALAVRPGEGGLPMIASAAGDRTIRFWQPTIGRMVRYVRLDAEPLGIAWTTDGSRMVASCVDGLVRLIDPDEVKVTQTWDAIDGWAYTVAAHPADGSVVVGGSAGQLTRLTP